jgi:aryl-alcohol dehydrogenase-like predicted oxidoreductase
MTRRRFLGRAGAALIAGGAGTLAAEAARRGPKHQVKKRRLGKTGLMVSEIGFGGHSWEYKKVPDPSGLRRVSEDEAVEIISAALDMGVNFFDADTAISEHEVPGKVLKRINRADDVIVCVRLCHKSHGKPSDKDEIHKFIDERLKLWPMDCVDLMMVSMTTEDYWDMSYCIEALDKVKQQGKIRFTGFGSHFTPENYLEALAKYGDAFDICSAPYNVRHRAAEEVFPVAEEKNLGIVTIKPFARGSLLEELDLEGEHKGTPRRMVAFVLQNKLVDCCLTGLHTFDQMLANFSASWIGLSPEDTDALDRLASAAPPGEPDWLERSWVLA